MLVPSSTDPTTDESKDRNRRWLFVGLGLAAVIVVVAVVMLTKGSNSNDSANLATDVDRPAVTTTIAPKSSVTTAVPTTETPATTADTTPTTTVPGSTPTTAKAVIPGQPPTTPTTAVPFPNFAGTTMSMSSTSVLEGRPPLILNWSVVADQPVAVTVSGPNFLSGAMSDSDPVCPIPLDSSGICHAAPGVYSYTIRATDSLGREFPVKTVQFTITASS